MDELEQLEQLIDELLQGLRTALESGEVLSDDFQMLLAQELTTTTDRIEELRAQAQQQEPQQNEQNQQIPSSQPPEDARLLYILSGGDVNAFVSYLRTFPGANFENYLNNPNALAQLIQQLQQTNPIPEAGMGSDGIPDTQLQSSNVKGMKYDPKSQKLLVKFHGNNRGNSVYQYDSVPPQIFQLLQHGNAFAQTNGSNRYGRWWRMKNPSLGAAVNQYLKAGGYAYRRIR